MASHASWWHKLTFMIFRHLTIIKSNIMSRIKIEKVQFRRTKLDKKGINQEESYLSRIFVAYSLNWHTVNYVCTVFWCQIFFHEHGKSLLKDQQHHLYLSRWHPDRDAIMQVHERSFRSRRALHRKVLIGSWPSVTLVGNGWRSQLYCELCWQKLWKIHMK